MPEQAERTQADGAAMDEQYGDLTVTTTALGTLPTGHRPTATVHLPVTVLNDSGGTPAYIPARVAVTSAGVATLASTVTLTGNIATPLTGLSFQVAS